VIRPYRTDDFEIVTDFWLRAQQVAVPELVKRMGYEIKGARQYFREAVVTKNKIWVYELDGAPVAFIAIRDDFIEQFYVDPQFHRQGIGKTLLDHARGLSPDHLWLYTNQINSMARAFYEKNGFVATRFGFSPPPESEPDMEYHWWRIRR
jgi:ribosomal protein S18 acetylase RimI-like enzyme